MKMVHIQHREVSKIINKLIGSFHTLQNFFMLGHDPSQNLIKNCQVVTVYKI